MLVLFLSFVSFNITSAYVAKYKEFNVGSSGGTYYNSSSFSGGGGSGTVKFRNVIQTRSGVKYLDAISAENTVSAGEPYYTFLYAESKTESTVYFNFKSKYLRDYSLLTWSCNIKNPTSTTLYLMSDNVAAIAGVAEQFRYVSLYNY